MFPLTGLRGVALALSTMIAALYAPTDAAHAADPIKIGFGIQLTGPLAGNGKAALLGAQIWADEVNKAGGLIGRQVELVPYDDQSNPGLVPGIYSKLLDVDKVDLLLSNNTNQTAPAMPTIIQHKRLIMGMFALAINEQFKYPGYFQIQPYGPNGKDSLTRGFFENAIAMNPKPTTVALVGADAEFSKNALEGARMQAKRLGLTVVYDKVYPPTTVNFTPVLKALQATSPDLVFVASYPSDTVGIIRTAHEINLEPKVFGGAMVGTQYAAIKQQLGEALNGVVSFEQYIPEPTVKFPGIEDMLKKYQAKAAEVGVDALGYYVPAFVYSALQVLGEAVTKTGGVDQQKLISYIHGNTFQTVVGDIAFGPDGEWVEPRMFAVQFRNIKGNDIQQFTQAGKEVIIFPPKYKSGDLVYPFANAQKAAQN
ncbi:amino acid ABC transporter substrate-binding protein [Bradyrhizobium sp. CCGUVB14]|uniref:amino acid ABC transporter substrate-binding protein n=1 Tax=Bradyrhizobium sp. CCGUVB14 TaxID=2949628 RepID=UPI0020B1C469|nr:amino acid ABC transporter substrate-binding protein [Bradyrhizobium sp. CCGUVB14]MCP3446762.1 amino acid ABC transporter substrate-binding protein [Bradyrhizobium sp. CCGUVB14]